MAAVTTLAFICFAMAGFVGMVVNSSVRFEEYEIGVKCIMIFIYLQTVKTNDDL
jgi:hypothetical protein